MGKKVKLSLGYVTIQSIQEKYRFLFILYQLPDLFPFLGSFLTFFYKVSSTYSRIYYICTTYKCKCDASSQRKHCHISLHDKVLRIKSELPKIVLSLSEFGVV